MSDEHDALGKLHQKLQREKIDALIDEAVAAAVDAERAAGEVAMAQRVLDLIGDCAGDGLDADRAIDRVTNMLYKHLRVAASTTPTDPAMVPCVGTDRGWCYFDCPSNTANITRLCDGSGQAPPATPTDAEAET